MAKPITKEWLKKNLKKFDVEVAERKYLYKIKKLEEAEEGYISSYKLIREQNDEEIAIGDIINIPKDYLVKKAEVKVCEEDDKPVEGYKVGDKYLDFTINTKDSEEGEEENESHIYILFRELVDLRAGEGIVIEEGGTVGVNYASDMRIGTEEDGEDKDKLTLNYETEDLDFSDWDTYEPNEGGNTDPEEKTIEFSCDDETVTFDEETKTLTATEETGSNITVTLTDGEKSAILDITVGTEGYTATLSACETDELPKDIGNGWTLDNIAGDKSVYDALFA